MGHSITEESPHRWRVLQRKRDIMAIKNDIENGVWEGETLEAHTQILPDSFRGTHPKRSFLVRLLEYLTQLLP